MRCSTRLLLTVVFVLPFCVAAQSTAPGVPDWENPRVFGIGKEPPRAHYTPYRDAAAAQNRADSSLVESLNGQWKFHWVKSPELRPIDFYKPGFDVSAWKEIPVPS